jgi:MFS family permease
MHKTISQALEGIDPPALARVSRLWFSGWNRHGPRLYHAGVNLIKWFPDRRGMATSFAIMGYGGGALIGSPLAVWLMARF